MGVKGKHDDDDEADEDSEIDIKVDELLEDLTINDKEEEKRKGSLDIGAVNSETKEEETPPNKKLIGKRDRKGENI
jgi:hypothetical protein